MKRSSPFTIHHFQRRMSAGRSAAAIFAYSRSLCSRKKSMTQIIGERARRGERLLENMRLMTLGEAVLLLDKPFTDGWQPILTRWHPSIQ